MTAHNNTKGTTAVMNPSIPPAPESPPGRKSTFPDKSTPGEPQPVNPPTEPDKSQQQRAPERVIETTSRSSNTKPDDGEGDIIGEYVLGETIGKGTFGKVKLGLHLFTGEKVAVKILEKKRIVQVADVERVAREIKILKRNRHPNVIQLYEVIDSPERIFLIMEHINGGEMFEYIVAHHRIREPEAAFLFRQIVDGLAYLHSNEVTHRDLKPENLLLQSTSRQQEIPTLLVKIVDFGLSNMHDGGRLLRTACGSPCYAAPEMIQGRMYHGPIADMWSLGVVLFAMVCGFLPFEDSNTNLLYKKILSANYKMPTFLSANAQDLIRRIIETDPEKRYTVDKIRQHPWLAGVETPDLASFGVRSDEVKARHDVVLSQLEALGLSRDEVQMNLSKKAYNRFTASYFLLDSKLQRLVRNRVVPLSVTGNSSAIERPGSSVSSNKKRPERQQEATVRSGGNDVRINSSAGSKTVLEVTGTPRRGGEESSRRKSTPQNHHHPSQPLSESPYARRVGTPSNAAPRHRGDSSVVAQRPSSVRGGRHLVMVKNGSGVSSGAGFFPVAPVPPRDHRHSGVLTARKPHCNTRVSVSNGMVALRPLVQPTQPIRRELPPPSARRHSTETPQHLTQHYRNVHDSNSTHMNAMVESSHNAITSSNGGVVIRRRHFGPAHPPPHTTHTHSPHQPFVSTIPTSSSSLVPSPPQTTSSSKSDDARAPQRIPSHC